MDLPREDLAERLGTRKHAFPNTPGEMALCQYGCGCYIDPKSGFRGPDGDSIDPLGFCPKNPGVNSHSPH